MTTLVEQPCVSSLDHHGCSQSSNCSQQFAQTFGGGKPISEAAVQEEMSQGGLRSETPSMNADMGDVTDSASKKRKSEDECPEDFMTQHSQDDAVYQNSQSPEEGLMNVEEHKRLYLQHLRQAVNTADDSFDLDSAMDPLFSFFSGKLTDRTEQGRMVTALILVILKNNISTVQDLLEWGSKCKSTEFAAQVKVESEVQKIIASLPVIFRPAGGIPETPAANARPDVVSETPPSQAPSSPTSFHARNLRQEMSPAIGSTPGAEDKRAASVAVERSSPRGASAGEEGYPTEREVERHVEKAEEIQNSVSVLKIKRRRLMQQVEHVRSMEQTRKEADKVVKSATANHLESSSALEEAKEALAAAEARVLQAAKKEREDKEEEAVAKLRAEQAAAEARHARSLMDNDKKEFEHILVRLRRTVRPESDSQGK